MTPPADTSVQSLVLWAVALTTVFNFVSLIWGVFSGPARKVAAELDGFKQRVATMEQQLRSIPATEDMHQLELGMARMQGELKTMSETMRGQNEIMKRLEAMIARHEDHLLKK